MTLLTWALYAAAILAGVVGHEVAHWIVWRVTGRRPTFGLRSVRPRAGPPHTTPGDRVAAAAPYVLGASAMLVGVLFRDVVWVGFGWGLFRIPSRVDVAVIRGQVEWMVESGV